jgi:hypothetical protein
MVFVRAGTPMNLTIAAAGLLHLMSARKLPKMSQIAMLVGAAGGRTLGIFDVEKRVDFGEKPVNFT